MKTTLCISSVLGVLLAASTAHAAPFENTAAGAAYTLAPAPQYAYCTDPGDATQLTDGTCVEGHFWTQPGTVGWTNAKPVVITVDLGADHAIRGVSFNTAAGAADVAWPVSIGIYVAETPGAFHRVGDLVTLGAKNGLPPAEGYAIHRYWTDALQTHGLYVAFAVLNVPFAFVDEIEVYAGDEAWLASTLPGAPVADVAQDIAQLQGEAFIRRRLAWDLRDVRQEIEAAAVEAAQRTPLLDRAAQLETGIAGASPEYGPGFRAILPLNPMHAEIFQLQAALWRALGLPPVVVWQSGLWEFLPVTATPRQTDLLVDIHAMQNEFRAGAFNLSNATDVPMTLHVTIDGLPGGVNPAYVRVQDVPWTDTNAGVPVAAALPDATKSNAGYSIDVPSGMTRQIWLTFHPADVPPGTHEGVINVTGDGVAVQVPVRLHIYPATFPREPRLHFGGWDYSHGGPFYGVTESNRDALIALLREHFVDSPWATSEVMPFGKYDAEGNMTEEPDTAAFETWLARWPGARNYCVFVAVTGSTLPFPSGSNSFTRAVHQWSAFWARQARVMNMILPGKFSLLIFDEPGTPEQQALITDWGRALRSAGTGFKVWEDPVFSSVAEASRDMLEVCDVLCPNRPLFLSAEPEYRDLFTGGRPAKTALEFYSCSGPVRLLDPYSYHRLQAWDCWRFGAIGEYFWAFGDSGGGSSWNEYSTQRAAYTPLFLDDTGVTSGKHLEACREGIEDYETLAMLQDAVRDAKTANKHPDWVARAEQFLSTRPTMVAEQGYLPSFQWKDLLDRTLADTVRVEALELLAEVAAKPQ